MNVLTIVPVHRHGGDCLQTCYSVAPMVWEAVNAQVFESATHRVRRVGSHWIAERKSRDGESSFQLEAGFERQHDAQLACENDARKRWPAV